MRACLHVGVFVTAGAVNMKTSIDEWLASLGASECAPFFRKQGVTRIRDISGSRGCALPRPYCVFQVARVRGRARESHCA